MFLIIHFHIFTKNNLNCQRIVNTTHLCENTNRKEQAQVVKEWLGFHDTRRQAGNSKSRTNASQYHVSEIKVPFT